LYAAAVAPKVGLVYLLQSSTVSHRNLGDAELERFIAAPTFMALRIRALFNNVELGVGTGSVVLLDGNPESPVLVTARHVLAGRRWDNNRKMDDHGRLPDQVMIRYPTPDSDQWEERAEALYDDNEVPLWWESPEANHRIDVVALPLTNYDEGVTTVPLRDYGMKSTEGPVLGPSSVVSIIGYPFDTKTADGYAIWAQGAIATDLTVDFNEFPTFLVDSRTRPGQSGAPVIYYNDGGRAYRMASGDYLEPGREVISILGIYSGRINDESDLGLVFKREMVQEILTAKRRSSTMPPFWAV
jgi:hypothetical protein